MHSQIEQASGRVTLTNEGEQCVSFHVCGSPNSGAADAPIPEWLDVHPTSGDLQPQVCTCESLEVQIYIGRPMAMPRESRRMPVCDFKARVAMDNAPQAECKQAPRIFVPSAGKREHPGVCSPE